MKYFGLGFIAGAAWLYALAHIPRSAALLFAIIVVTAIAAIAAWRYAGRSIARIAVGFAAVSVIAIAGAIYMTATVLHEAEASAAGRPFCLQVASSSDYAPARTLLDLSPLTMHAATAIGRSMNAPRDPCRRRPRRNAALTLVL